MDDKVKSKLCFWLVIAFYVLIAGGIFYGGYLTGIKHCKKGMPDISTTSKVDRWEWLKECPSFDAAKEYSDL